MPTPRSPCWRAGVNRLANSMHRGHGLAVPVQVPLAVVLGFVLLLPVAARADDFQEGYRKGFEDGFAAGQRAGVAAPAQAPPAAAVVPAPVINRGIIIARAAYGDGRRRCEYTGQLAGMANGRMRASIEVTNNLCGDPAPGERKSLKVEYTCGGPMKQADAFEHRTLYLNCP